MKWHVSSLSAKGFSPFKGREKKSIRAKRLLSQQEDTDPHHVERLDYSLSDSQQAGGSLDGISPKRDDIDFTKVGPCYKMVFKKQESPLIEKVSLELGPSRSSTVDCTGI